MTVPINLVTDKRTNGVTLTSTLHKNVILSTMKHPTTIEHFPIATRRVSKEKATIACFPATKGFVYIFWRVTCTFIRNILYVWTKRIFLKLRSRIVTLIFRNTHGKVNSSNRHKLVASLRCRNKVFQKRTFLIKRIAIVRRQIFL